MLNFQAVYQITNTITGQTYIGSTSNYRKRMQKWRDWKNTCSNHTICADFEKYGFYSFKFEVLKCLPDDISKRDREKLEYEYIHRLKPYYNEIGKPRSEETKRRLSMANIGKPQKPEDISKRAASLRKRFSEIPRDGSCTFKPVVIVETGEVFESVKATALALGRDSSTVTKALKNAKRTVNGVHVAYLECRD